MFSQARTLIPRVGVASLSSPLEVGADRAAEAARQMAALLKDAGCEVVELGAIDDPGASVAAGRRLAESHVHAAAFVATSWHEDYLVLDLLEESGVPVLDAHDLPAASAGREDGGPDDGVESRRVAAAGVYGEPTDALTAAGCRFALGSRFGHPAPP